MNGWTNQWTELDRFERCFWRRVGALLGVLIIVLLLAFLLQGCAAAPQASAPTEMKVCYVRLIEEVKAGGAVVLQTCQPAQQFIDGMRK